MQPRPGSTGIEDFGRQSTPPTAGSEPIQSKPSTVSNMPVGNTTTQPAMTSFDALPGYLGDDAPDPSVRDPSISALRTSQAAPAKNTATDMGDMVMTLVVKGVDYFFQRYSMGRNDHAHASYFSTIMAAVAVVLLERTMADQKGSDWPLLVGWDDGLAVGGIYLAGEVLLEWIFTVAEARNGVPVGSVPDLACTFRIVCGFSSCVGFIYGAYSGVNRVFDNR
ncbi:hypothetical protein HDU96_001442 [Phlyctochytrium bullatum]|nr:hypothetical protein HDU96_001442 [Phlyctochytrium bullatum]